MARTRRIRWPAQWRITPRICSRCSAPGESTTTPPRSSAILRLGLEVRTSAASPPTRHIGILGLRHEDVDSKDVVTASLESINLATVGSLAARAGAKTTFEPLLLSSESAAPIPAQRFNALVDPATLRDGFKSTGVRYAIAARITGPVESAYPQRTAGGSEARRRTAGRAPHQVHGAGQHRRDRRHRLLDGLSLGANPRNSRSTHCSGVCQQRRFGRQHSRQFERQQRPHQHSRSCIVLASLRAGRCAAAPGRRSPAQQGIGTAVRAAADRAQVDRTAKQAQRSDPRSCYRRNRKPS